MSDSFFNRNGFGQTLGSQSPFGSRIARSAYSSGSGYGKWGNQTSALPATWMMIGINVAVFASWTYARNVPDHDVLRRLNDNFVLSMRNWREGRQWTLITSAFSHIELWHIAFNMLAFQSFGSMLSCIRGFGAAHLLALSLTSGVAGSVAWLGQQRAGQKALGASGIVMGVGTAAACLWPYAAMNIMFIPISVPLWTTTLGYIAIDTFFLNSEKSPIAHAAHLGGAVGGAAYYVLCLRGLGGVLGRRRF